MTTPTTTTGAPDYPAVPTMPEIDPELKRVNAANQANSCTGIYGLSGSGKSSLADTAAEYAWSRFKKTTLCYASDLGGWGTKRIALIRAGILRVWDPRNHVNPIETMELLSLGAWPEVIEDEERGYAAPDVKLILPRALKFKLWCPNGHAAGMYDSEAAAIVAKATCPTCGVEVTKINAQGITKVVVRHRMFKDVGLRIYDSLTSLNEWGLNQVLPTMSAMGQLPKSSTGGSALGSADALREGGMAFGTGSMAQVGFMQARSYGWLANIRSIPDQVIPAVVTFGVEVSKADDESGGLVILGPKIAGNARTSSVPGWLGNCLHASKEPKDTSPTAPMVYRLWLTNHVDPRDPRKIPYLAKHRGIPAGMPDYLEDPVEKEQAWSQVNLGVFFGMLEAQLAEIEKTNRGKYPDAPAYREKAGEEAGGGDEEIAETTLQSPGVRAAGVSGGASASTPVATVARPAGARVAGAARPVARPQVAGARVPAAAPAATTPPPPATPPPPPPSAPSVPATASTTATPGAPSVPSPAPGVVGVAGHGAVAATTPLTTVTPRAVARPVARRPVSR